MGSQRAARLLIVEDEDALAQGLKFNFEQEGHEVVLAGDGPAALRLFQAEPAGYDLVVLDLMLPGMSGYEICRAIREADHQVPVLVLSARSLSEDKTLAFEAGTDQYMTKPFALRELLARVRNLLERRPRAVPGANSSAATAGGPPGADGAADADREEYAFGDVRVQFRKFQAVVRGRSHALTTLELRLLRYLIDHEGEVVSRSQILDEVWGQNADVATRTIDNFILRLRKLLEPNPAKPSHITSVRGTGYRFTREPADVADK